MADTMRRLFPAPVADVDPAEVYGPMTPGRRGAAVRVNMVESVDGAASNDGRSGGLSSPADKALFRQLRAAAEVVLVGASTVRVERYGPPKLTDGARAAREAAGMAPVPVLAIVTASCRLDVNTPLFTEAEIRPVVLTVSTADEESRARIAERADVVIAGDARVELGTALDKLAEHGWTNILCEGGPSLVGELLVEDLVDELCVTLAPLATSGGAPRIAHGAPLDPPVRFELRSVLEEDAFLFLRYGRERPGG